MLTMDLKTCPADCAEETSHQRRELNKLGVQDMKETVAQGEFAECRRVGVRFGSRLIALPTTSVVQTAFLMSDETHARERMTP